MLERVKQQPQKTTGDVLDNALSWKIPVYPLAKFLTWLEKVSNKTNTLFKDQNTNSNSSNSVGRGVKILTGSFLKIETGSRPEFKQFAAWPALGLALDRSSNSSVAAPFGHEKEKPLSRSLHTSIKKELNCNEQAHRMTRKVGRTAKEASSAVGGGNGYCEICRIHYDQLDSHTVSAQHLKLVTDSAQYAQLDSIILQNNLGPNSLRKSLRIAKSPPPFLPTEMGGKPSSGAGSATPVPPAEAGANAIPCEVVRNLRLRECSVALGSPNPILNGYACPSNRSTRSSHRSKNSSPSSSVSSYVPQVPVNGYSRKSQRSQPQCDVGSDGEGDMATPPTDRNLRSRKASSAQTPMTPPAPERLPSPPPVEKLGPPVLRSGTCSERAVTRLDRSLPKSEDRIYSTRSSAEREKSWEARNSEKDRWSLRQKSPWPPEKATSTSMTTRSCRELSSDLDKDAPSKSPLIKNVEKAQPKNERPRRFKEEKDCISECSYQKSRKKEESVDKKLNRTKREEKLLFSASDKPKLSVKDQKVVLPQDREIKSERSLRIKERTYYEELESEESSPVWPAKSQTPKQSSRKKKATSKPRVPKKRLSVEEKLIEDNKSYYKVEVLNSKLRSTEYFVNQKQGWSCSQGEERLNGEVPPDEMKPVVVRFKKIRTTELALLSDEAESFMFGEPKKEETDDENEVVNNSESESEEPEPTIKEEPIEEPPERLTSSVKTETDSSSHSDLISVQDPPLEVYHSPEPLPLRIKLEHKDELGNDEEIEEDATKIRYSFERPLREPWLDALLRQREGTEFYIPMAHKYPKVLLPYEIKRRRRKSKKGEETEDVKEPAILESQIAPPSSPVYCKDRVPRIVQTQIEDDQPRKSPRHPGTIKRDLFDGSGPVVPSDNNTLKTSEGLTADVDESCHASTLAIMSSIMRRRPVRECADKCINYEEESSLPETIESSGSNSNSLDAKVMDRPVPRAEVDHQLPPRHFQMPFGGDRIAEALMLGKTYIDDYEPASCLMVDPACIDDDIPIISEAGFHLPVDEVIMSCSSCPTATLDEVFLSARTFSNFHRPQADSCASSDCSDFLGFMEDGQAATKKRKKRRNLTGWPLEKPRKRFKDKELITASPSLPNLTMNSNGPEVAQVVERHSDTFSPRRRSRPGLKIRPCLSATLPIPSLQCKPPHLSSSSPPRSPYSSEHSALPPKKKLSRFATSRSLFKH